MKRSIPRSKWAVALWVFAAFLVIASLSSTLVDLFEYSDEIGSFKWTNFFDYYLQSLLIENGIALVLGGLGALLQYLFDIKWLLQMNGSMESVDA